MEDFSKILIKAGFSTTVLEYLTKYLITFIIIGTAIGGGIGAYLMSIAVQTGDSMLYNAIFLGPLLGFIGGIAAVFFYPYILTSNRKNQINNVMPLLVTYMGGISTSNASRDQLFQNVGKRKNSFGLAATEIKRIRTLAVDWNMGYIYSTKRVADTTPSPRFGDFLSRFAQALDSGENLSSFFRKEQDSILASFVADYTRKLKSLETLNDAYVAVSVSTVFMAITFLIMMYLFGSKASNNEGILTILFIIELINAVILLAFNAGAPSDPLISRSRITKEYQKLIYAGIIGLFVVIPIVVMIMMVLVVGVSDLGTPIYFRDTKVAVPIFMIITGATVYYPGHLAEEYEKNIQRRDENFPILIRTLGSTTAIIGGSIFDSVKLITRQHFGPLTEDIKLLYAQAQFGIDPHVAWKFFSDSTSSSIIDRFLKIFTSSLDIGGSPAIISEFISINVERVLRLRKDKIQVLGTFKGTLLPLAAINIALMVFMRDVLTLLGNVMMEVQQNSSYGGVYSFGVPPDIIFLELYFNVFYLTIPIFSCFALTLPRKGTPFMILKYLSIYYLVMGIEILIVGVVSESILGTFGGVYGNFQAPT
ncbi:MAG: type II secretion system F family protein [Promethearchaeota archaeon]